MVQMDYLHGYDSACIILCYGYHCSYTHFCDVLAISIMIWRSYKYVDLDVYVLCIDVPT